MRPLPLLLLLLLFGLPSAPAAARPRKGGDEDLTPEARIAKELGDLRSDAAEDHRKLARWCRSHELRRTSVRHLRIAFHLDPDSSRVRLDLGYKKVKGEWVQKRPPDLEDLEDEGDLDEDYVRRDGAIRTDRWKGLVRIADEAKELGLGTRATELLERARALSPQNHDVCTRLGFRRIGERWFSPAEAAVVPETVECREVAGGSAIGKQLGLSLASWRSGGWVVESAAGAEGIRHLLTATRRGEALSAYMRTGGRPDPLAPGLTVTALGDMTALETFLERTGVPEAQAATARATGQIMSSGCLVYGGEVSADWLVHGQAATLLWSLGDVPSWFVSGFSDYLSERIVGTMETSFVTVERSAGVRESAAKEGSESWRLELRNMALLEEDPKCGILFSSSLTGMTVADVMKAWSLVDFLYRRDRGAFAKLASGLVDGDTVRALREAYGMSPDELDAAWREWIIEVG